MFTNRALRSLYCVSGVTDSFLDSLKHLNAVRKRSVLFVLCPCVSGNSVSAVKCAHFGLLVWARSLDSVIVLHPRDWSYRTQLLQSCARSPPLDVVEWERGGTTDARPRQPHTPSSGRARDWLTDWLTAAAAQSGPVQITTNNSPSTL